ncbi:K(+)-transporting ATPase subunit F [Nocardiopsis changdeensis]|uniref:K(+)-transporting ATPase subunit F n=1 Tax=Nocardiopsis changdeensis TaxID=2831969 RepID=A0ABX8BE37_9ACTN|nr:MULTISPECIES: K(+)-transporting ATPase subunit F [Nocardiopsis]QUX20505.1 K(+)-transporting ATPase subunit F [Nocardiopsis changdeensis]QYX36436.1 K(+)-transporting ATPase subunit F [Nocardiopsis sp. MT53]
MTWEEITALAIAIPLAAYLAAALLFPERF